MSLPHAVAFRKWLIVITFKGAAFTGRNYSKIEKFSLKRKKKKAIVKGNGRSPDVKSFRIGGFVSSRLNEPDAGVWLRSTKSL